MRFEETAITVNNRLITGENLPNLVTVPGGTTPIRSHNTKFLFRVNFNDVFQIDYVGEGQYYMPELDLGSYGQNSEHGHKSSHKH
jgi:hypothetical protein